MIRHLLIVAVALTVSAPLRAQDTKLPNADDVKALLGKYQAERKTVVDTGVAKRFLPALLDRADGLATKGEAALKAGRFLQATEAIRQARSQLPYQSPSTPKEHVARIIGNPRLRHAQEVYAVVFSLDGQRLASASGNPRSGARDIKIWDLGNGQEILTYDGHDDIVKHLAFTPDGTLIASAGREAIIKLWEPATGKDKLTLKAPGGGEVNALAFSRDR